MILRAPKAVALSLLLATAAHGGDFIKGITISAQTWGREWQTPEMAAALDEVKSLGANAIAIHPYARIQNDGRLKYSADPEPDYVTKPLDWARERGLRAMLIPHVAYWGSPWLWRGEIDFPDQAGWDRFFNDYEKWITQMARLAEKHGAPIFCIGLEYSHAVKFEQRWRQIIKNVRAEFHGKITYGANWDTIDDVPFWDAVDYIGTLAYFPLCKDENPTAEQINAGWQPWLQKLGGLSKRHGKEILFVEIGYTESERCAEQPWDFHHRAKGPAAEIQARCVERALQLNKDQPFLAGMFWWKWYPDLPMRESETFDLRTPALKKLIAKYWAAPVANAQP